jgi:TonB family protein
MEPTLVGDPNIKVPLLDYARWGSPSGVNGPPSGGPGKCCGIGTGEGDGIGDGKGPGLGPGEGSDGVTYNGSTRGALTAPVLLWKTDPEYSEDARKARLQGTVVLRIEVNTNGQAQNISVRQHLGLGLDERAMEAVRRWKFKPGSLNGKPAVVLAYVEVNFRLL